MGQYDDRPYEVGKGKPPRQHSWQKGRSGNPRGPRRQPKQEDESLQQMLAEIANMPIEVVDKQGRSKTYTMKKAILLELARDALKGTPAQRRQAASLLMEANFFELTLRDRPETAKEREKAIESFVAELARFAEEEQKRERERSTSCDYAIEAEIG